MSKNEPPQFMFVDDDEVCNFLVKRWFNELGLSDSLIIFDDIEEAQGYIRTCEPVPKYLFLDLNQPKYDGIRFMEIYCEEKLDKRATKIFILTTSTATEDVERTKLFPCIEQYLEKPLQIDFIKKLIG